MPNAKCAFQKEDGESCQGYSTNDSPFCFVHDPAKKEEQREAAVRGGKTHARAPLNLEPIKMTNYGDVLKLIEETINGVRTGQMDWREANTLARLALIQAKLWRAL